MRREFLKKLLGLGAVGLVAPAELLKGRSMVSLYTPSIIIPTASQVVALELDRISKHLPKLFDRDDAFFSFISKEQEYFYTRDMRIPLTIKPGGRF